MTQPVKIAVTGGGALLGQGILRALRSSSLNAHTIALDVSALSAGLYWTDESWLVPMATDSGYVDAIRTVLARTKPDILLVGTDVELPPLAAAREALEREFGTRVLVSSPEVVAIADDKYKTAQFFQRRGFPATASVLTDDSRGIEDLIARHGFPLIVKPRIGARSYGVYRVKDRAGLENALRESKNAVVQECIGEDSQEYTASGLCFDGKCEAVIVMRRDLRDGNTYRAFTVLDPKLDGIVRRWTEALQPYGPANFQFRIDRDGVPKVFEINGRFSGTTPLRAHAGFNEVELCVRRVLWNEPIVQPQIKPITILRHWSETVVDPARVDAITKP